MAHSPASLPIDAVLPQITHALQSGNVVLRAPTGAGKTTRVPPAMLDAGIAKGGAILVLQPRRIAARATAVRMASERNVELGRDIGFQTRFERRVSRDSKIICLTEGILLRRLLDDPFLDGVAAVVFDEFHERNLASDLALAMVRQVQTSVRPELRIVVMSATLDPAPIAAYLGDCATMESEGRTFPMQIEYSKSIERGRIEEQAASGVRNLLPRTPGDLLVFLPGVGEIRATRKLLGSFEDEGIAVHELYGDLPPERQDEVLLPGPRRKVILSTNVAETSLTIEGITGVVDTGLARIASYDEHTGLDRLQLMPISQASADQRAGRAGRTAPGICLRLWPEAAHRARPERDTPEIVRVDLSGAVLQVLCWIEPDLDAFPWFERPRLNAITNAVKLLERLEASEDRRVTELGRHMAGMPVSPRLARMLVEGQQRGNADRTALGAALLSERSPFLKPSSGRRPRHTSESDLLDQIVALEAFESKGTLETDFGTLHRAGAQSVLRVRDQLLRTIDRNPDVSNKDGASTDEAVLRTVLAGFPDRVAKRREATSRRAVMVGGRGVRLADVSAVDRAELFVCLDVEGSQGEALVRQASAIRREWLPEHFLQTRVDVFFDEAKQQLIARRRVLWDDLVLEESPAALPGDEATTQALVVAAMQHWDKAFPFDNDTVMTFVNRVRFLNEAMPELELPSFDDEELKGLLPTLCSGRRSLAEVRSGPWLDHLRSTLSYPQLQTIEREAPERLQVPSGSRIAVRYEPGQRPVLAARIQELFGLAETPRLAGGRVAVVMHLLAPNMRPQQITDDLRSFWNNTYQQVRKDLRGRYPKHSWPEDPWNAQPQSRPGKPRP